MADKYKFINNSRIKELRVELDGMFKEEDAVKYVSEYQSLINRLNAKEYSLYLDCTKMAVTPANVVPMLQDCFGLYKQSNYKKIIAKVPKGNGVILKMQFNRLAKQVGLDNFEVEL